MRDLYSQLDRWTRRRFIGIPLDMMAALLGLTAAGAGLLRLPMPKVLPTPSRRFRIGKAQDYPVGAERYFERERVLLRSDREGLSALSLVCTHLGCTVGKSAEGGFQCPCHGSRYRADGSVIRGPAPRSLRALNIAAEPSGWLVVDEAREVPSNARFEA